MVSFDEALKMLDSVKIKVKSESVPVLNSLHRVACRDIPSKLDSPAEDNSAMDGYAIKSSLTQNISAGKLKLEIEQDAIYAGDNFKKNVRKDKAVKIMTGGYLPDGLDAVIPFEDAKVIKEKLVITSPVEINKNVRKKGEDIKKGDKILYKNNLLTPEAIALLISCNIKRIMAYENIPASIISTGNEILTPNQKYRYGKIFNSNGILAEFFLSQNGCRVVDNVICKDNLAVIKNAIKSAMKSSKIIITSAGASFGEKDFTQKALAESGLKIKFRQVAIKPAKPFSFGLINDIPVFMLPGNPMAFFICLVVFLKRFLKNQINIKSGIQTIKSISLFKYVKNHKRTEFIPAHTDSENGCLYSDIYKKYGPANISALGHINSIVQIPENAFETEKGDYIDTYLI